MAQTAIITHFKKDSKGDVVYEGKKPVTITTEVDFPIKFGYAHYSDPMKVIGPYKINVEDILSIEVKE